MPKKTKAGLRRERGELERRSKWVEQQWHNREKRMIMGIEFRNALLAQIQNDINDVDAELDYLYEE